MKEKSPKTNKISIVPPFSDILIAVGLVLKAHGLHGVIKIKPLSDFSERYESLETVFLEMKSGEINSFAVEHVRYDGPLLLMKLKGIENRDSAEALRGGYVCVTREKVFSLAQDSYYVFDLIGMEVVTPDGAKIGCIKRFEHYPANDVMVVETETNDIMIPTIKEFVTEIDIETKRMVVNLIEGLPLYPKGSD